MKFGEVISALAIMRNSLMTSVDIGYSADEVYDRLRFINQMRDYVFADNATGFVDYTQTLLAGQYGDTMCDLLEELFAQLDVKDRDIDNFIADFLLKDG